MEFYLSIDSKLDKNFRVEYKVDNEEQKKHTKIVCE